MNLNVDVKDLLRKEKKVYPTKRKLNLYYKEDVAGKRNTLILYSAFLVVIAIALVKILVVDYIVDYTTLKNQDTQQQLEIQQKQLELRDYNKINEEYTRYAKTKDEENYIDRMEILNLVDEYIRQYATVDDVQIQDNSVLVNFSGVTLDKIAEINSSIQKAPLVEDTSVDTANSAKDNRDVVEASILIKVKLPEDEKNV